MIICDPTISQGICKCETIQGTLKLAWADMHLRGSVVTFRKQTLDWSRNAESGALLERRWCKLSMQFTVGMVCSLYLQCKLTSM